MICNKSISCVLAASGLLLLASSCNFLGLNNSSDSASSTDPGTTGGGGQQYSDGAPPLDTSLPPSGINVLHNFGASDLDGELPTTGLLLSGSTLYGMTGGGGMSDDTGQGPNCLGGTIFSVGVDGSNYSVLHCFQNSPGSAPNSPVGALILSGGTLYGATELGGANQCPWNGENSGETMSCGTIFSINTDGSNFTVLHSFAGGTSDGAYPQGSLTISGNTLYGTTGQGGNTGCTYFNAPYTCGTIFSISTDGSNFHLLHAFAQGSGEGRLPLGGLVLSGSSLYGMASAGGTGCVSNGGCGTIYSMNTDGSNFSILKYFDPGTGSNPPAGLTLLGNTLYGTTVVGGPDGCTGTLFSIGTDGTDFTIVHAFANDTEGWHPTSGVVASNGLLYGMSDYGGDANLGVIYRIGADGSGYTRVASFTGVNGDGAYPTALVADGNTLYGMTYNGGLYQGTHTQHNWCPIIYNGVYYKLGGCGVVYSLGI